MIAVQKLAKNSFLAVYYNNLDINDLRGKPAGFPRRLSMRLLGLNFIYWQYLSAMSNRENGYLLGFDTINDAVIAVN